MKYGHTALGLGLGLAAISSAFIFINHLMTEVSALA